MFLKVIVYLGGRWKLNLEMSTKFKTKFQILPIISTGGDDP